LRFASVDLRFHRNIGAATAHTSASGDRLDLQRTGFSIGIRQSKIANSTDSLISTYRKHLPLQASFYLILEVIPLNLPPPRSRERGDGLIEK
jgi:hypothetical protein